MIRSTSLVALLAAACLALPATAAGGPPTHERVIVDDAFTIPAGGLCEFDVDVLAAGRVLVTTHFNPDGSVDFISERPNAALCGVLA